MCVCESVSMLVYVHICVRTNEDQKNMLPGAALRGICNYTVLV